MGFFARLVGTDHVVRLINRRFDHLEDTINSRFDHVDELIAAIPADKAALEQALIALRAADVTIDAIQPESSQAAPSARPKSPARKK